MNAQEIINYIATAPKKTPVKIYVNLREPVDFASCGAKVFGEGLSLVVFGNWADLLVGEQLGLETYTTLDGSWTDENGVQHNAFEENLSATRALMYVDIAARHAESFIVVKNVAIA